MPQQRSSLPKPMGGAALGSRLSDSYSCVISHLSLLLGRPLQHRGKLPSVSPAAGFHELFFSLPFQLYSWLPSVKARGLGSSLSDDRLSHIKLECGVSAECLTFYGKFPPHPTPNSFSQQGESTIRTLLLWRGITNSMGIF